MGVLVTTTFGLVVWVVLWGMGVKGLDAFMITLALVVVASMARVVAGYQARDDH